MELFNCSEKVSAALHLQYDKTANNFVFLLSEDVQTQIYVFCFVTNVLQDCFI
jgi:hypothetical protein